MSDPFFDSLASALAGQAVAALSEAGKAALRKVRERVGKRSERDAETQATLAAAEQPSAGQPEIDALARRLDQLAQADPEWGGELRAEGAEVHREISASNGGVVNTVSGKVSGNVVQARDIHGSINIGN